MSRHPQSCKNIYVCKHFTLIQHLKTLVSNMQIPKHENYLIHPIGNNTYCNRLQG
jgi:hypothetical protein